MMATLVAASRAGVYDPGWRDETLSSLRRGQPLPFELFRDAMVDCIRSADAKLSEAPPRKALLARRSALRNRGLDRLSQAELTELGVVHVRLRELDAAIEALKKAESRGRGDFWIATTIGTAFQLSGQLREASRNLEIAQDYTPEPAWWARVAESPEWVKTVERAQLKLVRLRVREGAKPGPRATPPDVDELFPVKFVGPSGTFEAGSIAEPEKAKLPANAIAVVQQLLLWMPEDTRLYWLLGELYNANGDLSAADTIFEECVWSRRYDTPALREHRRVVKEELAARAPPPPPDWRPSWAQILGVGAVIGTVLAVLAYFQVREFFRRHFARPPA